MPFAAPDFLSSLLAKPVAIFGGGVSGEGVRGLLAALGVEGRVYDAKGAEFTAFAAHHHALDPPDRPGVDPDLSRRTGLK